MTVESFKKLLISEQKRLKIFKEKSKLLPHQTFKINCELHDLERTIKIIDNYVFNTEKESLINNK